MNRRCIEAAGLAAGMVFTASSSLLLVASVLVFEIAEKDQKQQRILKKYEKIERKKGSERATVAALPNPLVDVLSGVRADCAG